MFGSVYDTAVLRCETATNLCILLFNLGLLSEEALSAMTDRLLREMYWATERFFSE